MCAAALPAALLMTRGINPLNFDTPSYLYFQPSRTAGYPAFLWLVKLLTGHASAAVPVQMALLAASLFALGLSFHDLVGRPKLSLAFQLFLLCSPDLWRFSAELMTEALATAAVALWCAQLLRLINTPSAKQYLLLALVSAAAMLIRPSLAVLVAGTGIAALLIDSSRGRRSGLLSLAIITALAWSVTPLALFCVHGSAATTSPFARGVLQHTLFCDGAGASADPDAAFVDRDSAAVRQYVDSAPGDVAIGLEHLYSAPLRFDSIIPGLGHLHGFSAGWQTDPIVARVARERVEANPVCYARSVLRNYWELTTQQSLHVGSEGARVDRFLAAHPPVAIVAAPLLPTDSAQLRRAAAELRVPAPASHLPTGRFGVKTSPVLLLLGRLLYGLTALLGVLALAAVVLRRRKRPPAPHTVAIAAMGLAFHALFLGTAVVELSLIRYTVPAWPIVCTLLVTALAALLVRSQPGAASSIFEMPTSHEAAPAAALA
jgi:hypothetical protein